MPEDKRSQTEPIAALVAVSTVALALSLYGVVVLDVLEQDTDRELANPTVDQTWIEIRDDGFYDNTTEEDLRDRLEEALSNESSPFPNGYSVYVELVYLADDGYMTVIDNVTLGWTTTAWESLDGPVPEYADTASRPIPIQTSPGEVQTGTLRVEVWNPNP